MSSRSDATGDGRDKRDAAGDAPEQRSAPSAPAPTPRPAADFDTQYRPLLREVFAEIVERDRLEGADPGERARDYAERGKPDYVLAYLLVSQLADAEKRETYAIAHERRAMLTEQRARQFDKEFHRPFPLLFNEAAKDRALARQIRNGRAVQRGAGRHLPTI
jgi:hypothetical protein